MSKMKSFIFIVLCLFFATCLKDEEESTVSLNELFNKYTGKKGTLAISASSDYKFNEDTTRLTNFESNISDKKNSYKAKCGFWKATEDKLYVFCNIDTDIPAGNYTIDFTGIPKFNYQNQTIIFSNSKFEFEKLDKELIDLYSAKQEINIVDDKDSYELKFNVVSYNQEVLGIGFIFMECKQESNELICQIKKDDLEKVLTKNKTDFSITYIGDKDSQAFLPLVWPIIVIDNIVEKTDVLVGITKLIENVTDTNMFITYETNVTNINKVMIGMDSLSLEFENDKEGNYSAGCLLRKNDNYPLFVICMVPYSGTSWLKEIKKEIVLNNANVRYNFRIQPVKNEEKIYSGGDGSGTFIMWSYPEVLDFTKNDNLYIDYKSMAPNNIKGLTFNEEKEDLTFNIRENELLRCTVPKKHFEGKKTDYYFIKHTNYKNGKSTNYESTPVKIILLDPKPSKGIIYTISLYYSLLLILIMF